MRVEVVISPVDSFQGFRQRGENSPRVLAALAASDIFFAHGLIFRLVAAYLAGDKGKHGPQAVEEVFHQFALRAAFGVNMADAEAVQQPLDAVAFPDAALKDKGVENSDVPARPYHGPGDVLSAVRLLVSDNIRVGGNEAGRVIMAGQKLEASQPDAVFFRALVAGPAPGPGNAHAEVDRRVVPGRALSGPQEASVQVAAQEARRIGGLTELALPAAVIAHQGPRMPHDLHGAGGKLVLAGPRGGVPAQVRVIDAEDGPRQGHTPAGPGRVSCQIEGGKLLFLVLRQVQLTGTALAGLAGKSVE